MSFAQYLGDQPKSCGYHGCPKVCQNVREYEKHCADVHKKTPTQIAREIWDQALDNANLSEFKKPTDKIAQSFFKTEKGS